MKKKIEEIDKKINEEMKKKIKGMNEKIEEEINKKIEEIKNAIPCFLDKFYNLYFNVTDNKNKTLCEKYKELKNDEILIELLNFIEEKNKIKRLKNFLKNNEKNNEKIYNILISIFNKLKEKEKYYYNKNKNSFVDKNYFKNPKLIDEVNFIYFLKKYIINNLEKQKSNKFFKEKLIEIIKSIILEGEILSYMKEDYKYEEKYNELFSCMKNISVDGNNNKKIEEINNLFKQKNEKEDLSENKKELNNLSPEEKLDYFLQEKEELELKSILNDTLEHIFIDKKYDSYYDYEKNISNLTKKIFKKFSGNNIIDIVTDLINTYSLVNDKDINKLLTELGYKDKKDEIDDENEMNSKLKETNSILDSIFKINNIFKKNSNINDILSTNKTIDYFYDIVEFFLKKIDSKNGEYIKTVVDINDQKIMDIIISLSDRELDFVNCDFGNGLHNLYYKTTSITLTNCRNYENIFKHFKNLEYLCINEDPNEKLNFNLLFNNQLSCIETDKYYNIGQILYKINPTFNFGDGREISLSKTPTYSLVKALSNLNYYIAMYGEGQNTNISKKNTDILNENILDFTITLLKNNKMQDIKLTLKKLTVNNEIINHITSDILKNKMYSDRDFCKYNYGNYKYDSSYSDDEFEYIRNIFIKYYADKLKTINDNLAFLMINYDNNIIGKNNMENINIYYNNNKKKKILEYIETINLYKHFNTFIIHNYFIGGKFPDKTIYNLIFSNCIMEYYVNQKRTVYENFNLKDLSNLQYLYLNNIDFKNYNEIPDAGKGIYHVFFNNFNNSCKTIVLNNSCITSNLIYEINHSNKLEYIFIVKPKDSKLLDYLTENKNFTYIYDNIYKSIKDFGNYILISRCYKDNFKEFKTIKEEINKKNEEEINKKIKNKIKNKFENKLSNKEYETNKDNIESMLKNIYDLLRENHKISDDLRNLELNENKLNNFLTNFDNDLDEFEYKLEILKGKIAEVDNSLSNFSNKGDNIYEITNIYNLLNKKKNEIVKIKKQINEIIDDVIKDYETKNNIQNVNNIPNVNNTKPGNGTLYVDNTKYLNYTEHGKDDVYKVDRNNIVDVSNAENGNDFFQNVEQEQKNNNYDENDIKGFIDYRKEMIEKNKKTICELIPKIFIQ